MVAESEEDACVGDVERAGGETADENRSRCAAFRHVVGCAATTVSFQILTATASREIAADPDSSDRSSRAY